MNRDGQGGMDQSALSEAFKNAGCTDVNEAHPIFGTAMHSAARRRRNPGS